MTGDPPPAISATKSGDGSGPRAFRHGGSSFSEKFDAFLQERLRLLAAVLGSVAGLALAASVAEFLLLHRDDGFASFLGWAQTQVTTGVVIAAIAVRAVLGRRQLGRSALGAADVLLFVVALAAPLSILVRGWTSGEGFTMPFMVILVFARTIFVPSRAVRTFVLAAIAPAVVLVVELAHDKAWLQPEIPNPSPGFTMLWNQVVLWIAAALAAYASHTIFALRLEAYEAGRVGQYELEEKIGEGAMGEVWRARHGLLRRPTAVKLIRAEIVADNTRKRFEHEVRQTCRISHPNVIAVFDYGHTDDGVFFYAMELLDGEDLGRVVRDTGPMPVARAIHVLAAACDALAEAHAAGLVHRDVKPANIMVTRRGLTFDVVKVMDFGLVKDTGGEEIALTGVGEICGTPETIAPESIRGKVVGPAADIYAIGAVGVWLVTGRHVFDATTALEYVAAHLHSEPIRPSQRGVAVPADLEDALMRCLAKDPAARPASAIELRDTLLACGDAGRWTQADAKAWWATRRPAAAGGPESGSR